MSLFSSHRDDRRRRALAEDSAGDSLSLPASAPKSGGKVERYAAAAVREKSYRRTIDFIPRRLLPIGLGYAASLVAIGALVFGYFNASGESLVALGVAPLLDASLGGSLAGWLSSLMFGLIAIGSLLVYSIRRHRLDDYRGRYRLWLWCAAAWVAMSIDATANLHAPFSRAMAKATGWSMLPEGAAWWIGIWGLVLSVLSLRMILEMRECRSAAAATIAAIVLWIVALAASYSWLPLGEYSWLPLGENAMVVAVACRLLGQATLVLGITLYARHVLLDSEGLIKPREAKPKREKPAKKTKSVAADSDDDEEPSSSKSMRVDAAHKSTDKRTDLQSSSSTNRNASSSYSSNRAKSYEDDEDEDRNESRNSSYSRYDDEEDESDDDSYNGNRKLSKAERKKIRKQMRRMEREDDA